MAGAPDVPEAAAAAAVVAANAAQAPLDFLRLRWRGQAPLRTLFWRDMLAWGTALNLLCSFVALMAAALGLLPTAGALVLHFAPTPWNAFLVWALWRTPAAGLLQRWLALAWFGLMLVL